MKFIPEKLKAIFKRKAAKDLAPAPASMEAVAPLPAPVVEETPVAAGNRYHEQRLKTLDRYKTAEGYYQFSLDISSPGKPIKGNHMHMATSREADLYLVLITAQPLAGVNAMAQSFKETLEKNTGLKNTRMYFKLRQTDFHIDAEDDFIGLPPGSPFQLIVVPEDCAWKPTSGLMPRKTAPETCALLRPPYIPPQLRPNTAPRPK